MHQMPDRKGHVGRVAVLQFVAVDFEPEIQCLRIGDFIAGGNVRAERGERAQLLPLTHWPACSS